MRVIAGSAKGHHLRAPRGLDTRPTSDKVREAIFDVLGDAVSDASVLDLFAGTGALGIEALSRGASRAMFVEQGRNACQVIRANLEHTGLANDAHLLCMPVERALGRLEEKFDLIFLDPPYAYKGLDHIMKAVGGGRIIGDQTIVVLEHSPRFAVSQAYERLALRRKKIYGDTAVSVFATQEEQRQ